MSTRTISQAELPQYAAHALRFLAMDAVQKAGSGHPGMPMGMADIATVLWGRYLRFNPRNPKWLNRDRFVLSNGHGSMLLYGLLHLTGYDLPTEELKNFRQLHSRTPGHPEYGITPGVEVTTGPLGQGIANAVGMALGERFLAGRFNQNGHQVVDHFTYAFCSDGDLMEGISHEACSLAGHLGLSRLIALYDDNHVTIDGDTALAFSEDIPGRFTAYGWHVQSVDGHDHDQIAKAIEAAQAETERPSIICCRTVIGWGAPNKAGSASTHGAALGDEEIAATREALGWPWPPFEVPQEVAAYWKEAGARGEAAEREWTQQMEAYRKAHPEPAKELDRIIAGKASDAWKPALEELRQAWLADAPAPEANRKHSQNVLTAIGPHHPDLIGGSADLTPSNNTQISAFKSIAKGLYDNRYLHYGIREHGMGAIMNGLSLHASAVPYSGTFLTFSDYMRPSMRLAALMGIQSIYVFTHDSISLGEDGPTHQPIEHYAALRAMPNLHVLRPADARETLEAWGCALERTDGPSALLLSRGKVVTLEGTGQGGVAKGGYVLQDVPEGLSLQAVLMGTGSEVMLAAEARKTLAEQGIGARVVSLPCWELFEAQDEAYRQDVLRPDVPVRVAVEAGVRQGWEPLLGLTGRHVGMTGFGDSAPPDEVYKLHNITAEAVVAAVKAQL